MRLISADKCYEVLTEYYHHNTDIQHKALKEAIDRVPTDVEEHRVASMEMEIQFERAFHKWLDGKGFSHEDYMKLCVEFAKESAAQMFDEIDPKYANEIRNGLFDPDENEVLS
jgi:hypothetical protein